MVQVPLWIGPINAGFIYCLTFFSDNLIFEESIEYFNSLNNVDKIDKNKKIRSLEQNRRKARFKTYKYTCLKENRKQDYRI